MELLGETAATHGPKTASNAACHDDHVIVYSHIIGEIVLGLRSAKQYHGNLVLDRNGNVSDRETYCGKLFGIEPVNKSYVQ